MVTASLGSIADRVITRFPDISTHVSGALVAIADEQRLYMEEYTGLTIGSVGIAERFQPALFNFTAAAALDATKLDGANASRIRLGDLETEKSSEDNISTVAKSLRDTAESQLRLLGKRAYIRRVVA